MIFDWIVLRQKNLPTEKFTEKYWEKLNSISRNLNFDSVFNCLDYQDSCTIHQIDSLSIEHSSIKNATDRELVISKVSKYLALICAQLWIWKCNYVKFTSKKAVRGICGPESRQHEEQNWQIYWQSWEFYIQIQNNKSNFEKFRAIAIPLPEIERYAFH